MARLLLAGAIIFELVPTSCMKFSKGFSNLKFSIIMVAFYIASMLCGNFALKTLDVSMAYAIWSGVGIAGMTIIVMLLFKEDMTFTKIICITFIILGSIGLNFIDGK